MAGSDEVHDSRNHILTKLTLAVIAGNILTASVFIYFIYLATWRRTLALQGNNDAATRIILPCYRPMFRGMAIVYVLSAVALSCSFFASQGPADQFYELQFASLMMLTTFSVVPILLLQRSVTWKAFRTTACITFPCLVLGTLLWVLTTLYSNSSMLSTLFWILSGFPSLCLSFGMRFGLIKSRVHMNSRSARASVDYMLVYSVFYCVMNILGIQPIRNYLEDKSYRVHTKFQGDQSDLVLIAAIAAVLSILWNQLFPWAMYASLLADTKFWRGLGRHNEHGFVVQDGAELDRERKRAPTMDIRLVTHDLQGVMREIGDVAVDFAFLEIHHEIGKGAHASVYYGKIKNEEVAIKLFTPEEVNQETIQEFVREAKLSMPLLHPNIVNFMGICIRPPEIAMIMELCPGGDLKSNLDKNANYWTPYMRAQACLDGAHAVNYFHAMGYIHRDIKAENFFLTGDVTAIDHEAVSAALAPLSAEETKNLLAQRDNDNATTRDSMGDYIRDSLHLFSKKSPTKNSDKHRDDDQAKQQEEQSLKATKGFSVKLGDFGESTKQRLRSDGTVEVLNERLYNTQARGRAGALDGDDVVQVIDEETDSTRMSIKGTVAFLAPELVNAEKVYSEKVDIYSLGVTFLEIWTGQDPWRGKSVFNIYQAVETGQRPFMPEDIPEMLRDIIVSCWDQDPSKRPSADELTHLLEKFILEEYDLDMRRQQQFMTRKVRGSLGIELEGDKGIFPNISKAFKNAIRLRSSGTSRASTITNSAKGVSVAVSGRSSTFNNNAAGAGAVANPIYMESPVNRSRQEDPGVSEASLRSKPSGVPGTEPASSDVEMGPPPTPSTGPPKGSKAGAFA